MPASVRAFFCAAAVAVFALGLPAGQASAQTAAILLPGAGGAVPIDFLMRNRSAFAAAGVETFVVTNPEEAAAVSHQLKEARRRVVIVGMSRGGPAFVKWSGGRARVVWFDNSGPEPPNPCGPRGAHGFYMQDGPAMRAILAFVR